MRGNEWSTDDFQWNGEQKLNGVTANMNTDHDASIQPRQKINEQQTAKKLTTNDLRNTPTSYIKMLSNDDIVIVAMTSTPSPTNTTSPRSVEASGITSNKAGATIRGLSNDELPQPDTVRRAKEVFESLAKKHEQELERERATWTLPRKKKTAVNGTNIGRSQSMTVLTGRAWCNGRHVIGNHHRNGACSTVVNGTHGVMQIGRSNTLPPVRRYQRSCSELDKFFKKKESTSGESSDDDDDDGYIDRNDTGSPVSTEVIRKIREHGMCVTFFGREAYVEDLPSSDIEDNDHDDDTNDSGLGYLLDYPYDLYRGGAISNGRNYTSSLDRRIPKIISYLPKNTNNGLASSTTSGQSSSPSPASSTHENSNDNLIAQTGWLFSMDELKSTLNSRDDVINSNEINSTRSGSSIGSGNSDWIPINKCHGQWQKNPYWQGSYYVIYDFTRSDKIAAIESEVETNQLEKLMEQTHERMALEY